MFVFVPAVIIVFFISWQDFFLNLFFFYMKANYNFL